MGYGIDFMIAKPYKFVKLCVYHILKLNNLFNDFLMVFIFALMFNVLC